MKKRKILLICIVLNILFFIFFIPAETPSIIIDITNISQFINDTGFISIDTNDSSALHDLNTTLGIQKLVNNSLNSTEHWDNYNTANATQMENNGGVLNIVLSWLKGLFYTKAQVDTNLSLYILDSSLPLENQTISHCSNITGNASDLCTLIDTTGSDGNASSICSDNEVLLGQDSGLCTNLNDTIDDRDSDTIFNNTNVSYVNETNVFTEPQNFSTAYILDKTCFNDACTHYINETCHVWPSGGSWCSV